MVTTLKYCGAPGTADSVESSHILEVSASLRVTMRH